MIKPHIWMFGGPLSRPIGALLLRIRTLERQRYYLGPTIAGAGADTDQHDER